jgi:hypothetical protein
MYSPKVSKYLLPNRRLATSLICILPPSWNIRHTRILRKIKEVGKCHICPKPMIIKGKFLVNKCNIWQVFNWVDWVLTKNFYDALYLGTNFEPLNALYFRTEGVLIIYGTKVWSESEKTCINWMAAPKCMNNLLLNSLHYCCPCVQVARFRERE